MQNEIVVAPFVCQDARCDCDRLYQGMVSHGYSTEVQVVEAVPCLEAVVAACRSRLHFSQWAAVLEYSAEMDALAADLVDDMTEVADRFPAGAVLSVEFDRSAAEWRFPAADTDTGV